MIHIALPTPPSTDYNGQQELCVEIALLFPLFVGHKAVALGPATSRRSHIPSRA